MAVRQPASQLLPPLLRQRQPQHQLHHLQRALPLLLLAWRLLPALLRTHRQQHQLLLLQQQRHLQHRQQHQLAPRAPKSF
jgi:hypothetical protein